MMFQQPVESAVAKYSETFVLHFWRDRLKLN